MTDDNTPAPADTGPLAQALMFHELLFALELLMENLLAPVEHYEAAVQHAEDTLNKIYTSAASHLPKGH